MTRGFIASLSIKLPALWHLLLPECQEAPDASAPLQRRPNPFDLQYTSHLYDVYARYSEYFRDPASLKRGDAKRSCVPSPRDVISRAACRTSS